jgi:protein O-GlcNAc transferase
MRSTFLAVLFTLPLLPQAPPDSWTKPVEALIASGKLDEARSRLERETAARGENAPALLLTARILFEEHRYAESLKTLERCLALDPRSAEAYKLVALDAVRMNRLAIAEPALKAAAQIAPDDYLVHFHLGALYYTKSLFLAARPELERAAALKPDYMPARLFLGLTLEEVGEEAATIEQYRKAIDLAAAQKAAMETPYVHLGRYLYRLNRFEEALPLLRKAVELKGDSSGALLALAKTLHALNRDSEAVPLLDRAAAADPGSSETHYLLFRIYSAQGRDAQAQEEFRRFEQSQPEAKDDPRRRRPAGDEGH